MSIIFKEKNYDQLFKVIKIFLILLILVFIFLTILNYYCQIKINVVKENLKISRGEELKYKELIKRSKEKKKEKEILLGNYNLIVELTAFADQIYFNSIYFKKQKLLLDANTNKHDQIFTLINNLKSIDYISAANLIKINKSLDYNFQVECLIEFK